MIKSVISAGTKSSQFEGPIVKIGASNAIKLTKEVLDVTGAKYGHFAFIANDDEDSNLFYIATSEKAVNEAGERGSKLGIVGEVTETSKVNPNQLVFTHAVLGKQLFDVAASFRVDTEAGFEHNGLTFYPMTIEETREAVNTAKEAASAAKDEASEATPKKGGRKSSASAE